MLATLEQLEAPTDGAAEMRNTSTRSKAQSGSVCSSWAARGIAELIIAMCCRDRYFQVSDL